MLSPSVETLLKKVLPPDEMMIKAKLFFRGSEREECTLNIRDSRVECLNDKACDKGAYVLYWMQQSQRASENHALEYAIERADELGVGVLVGFGLTDAWPEANIRHYTFMLEGLKETEKQLKKRGIKMVVKKGNPSEVALSLGANAVMIVCDRGYLRHQRAFGEKVAEQAQCPVIQVESDVIIPLKVVSEKAEYAAYTIRRKIHRHLKNYLVPLKEKKPDRSSLDLDIEGIDLNSPEQFLKDFDIDRTVPSVSHFFKGGTLEGKQRFKKFLKSRFSSYVKHRNQPQTDDISHMSPYLHFGQISSLYLALEVQKLPDSFQEARESYLEELIVRRELAMNFCYYTRDYDAYSVLPGWARITLKEHRKDLRDPLYSKRTLEDADTHDPYWNAAMKEMKVTGFMHNYMRMYWGKKILEWSKTPEEAFETTLYLNNKYFLDGRDPNSYTGVAWVYGVHDRAWKERPIFGKVRYMAASGLERKCDIAAYVQKVKKFEQKKDTGL